MKKKESKPTDPNDKDNPTEPNIKEEVTSEKTQKGTDTGDTTNVISLLVLLGVSAIVTIVSKKRVK